MCNFIKIIIAVLMLSFGNVFSQQSDVIQRQGNQPVKLMELSGPRFGITVLFGEVADKLNDKFEAGPMITQFGWQFESRFFSNETGTMCVSEYIFLVGGVEQGVLLPSLSWLIGIRSASGIEFGVGPNLSLGGTAFVYAGGVTLKSGSLNFPINLALVKSKNTTRVSLMVGFNIERMR